MLAPYSLSIGDSVFAKVIASNIKGESDDSINGNNAIILTKPNAPRNLQEDTS
jgi:hypothetical protein